VLPLALRLLVRLLLVQLVPLALLLLPLQNPRRQKKGKKRAAEQPVAALEGQEGGGGKGKSKGPGTKERQKQLMSRKKFLETAESFKVQISDRTVTVPTKVFSTNSCGWFANPKVSMKLGGQEILVQCQIQCTVIGSKEWAEE